MAESISTKEVSSTEKLAYVRVGLRSEARKLEGKVIKRIFRKAEQVARLHATLTSRADDYFRRRLLDSLGDGLSGRELRNLATTDQPANLDRHIGKLLDLGLIEKSDHSGVERYRRTKLGDQSLDVLCTLERKLGEKEARRIYDANLGSNSIRLFLRIYGDNKPYPEKGLEVSYSVMEMGKMSLFLPRTMEGYSAIDKLDLAGLLVCDDDVFHVPSVKARTFYQYLKRLYAISRVARMMNGETFRARRGWAIETISTEAIAGSLRALGGEILSGVEKYLVVLTLASFIAGILLARVSPSFGKAITSGVSGFMDAYDIVGPLTCFVIIAPALAEMLVTSQKGRFGVHVIRWYAGRKALASLWAVVFTVLVFRLPILPVGFASLGEAVSETLRSTATMAIRSPYYLAMYAGLAVALVSLRVRGLYVVLRKSVDVVERAGQLFFPFVPLLMLAVGAYVYALPQTLKQRFGPEVAALSPLDFWGMKLDPGDPTGMVFIYLLGSILVAIACFVWHLSLVGFCMRRSKRFSLRRYFTGFWIPTYPLLWATSSEALATPLVLHLIKKHAPWVHGIVRRFVGGVGSYLDANGTIICVYVLAGLVAAILGLPFSLLEFAASIPLIVVLSYGIPGIPAELVIFAGPIALLMNVPEAALAIFLALYIGLQIGLPDSFRTGANSTDDYLNAVLMNIDYERNFMEAEEDVEVGQD